MDLSVIVPVYNAQDYLETSLESLALQRLDKGAVEFVLIDDGSTDSSLSIINEFSRKDERFVVISRENKGYGQTLNEGIAKARSDFIGVLEPDDFIEGQMYFDLLAKAKEFDVDIVRSNYKKFWTKPEIEDEVITITNGIEYGIKFSPQENLDCLYLDPAIWSMIVKKKLIVDNKISFLPTPGAAFQDTSYSFKLWACAKSALCVDRAYVNYRQDNENSSINNPNVSEFVSVEYEEIYRFICENFGGCKAQRLSEVAMRRQFLAYVWNYERLEKKLHFDFAKVASCDLERAFRAGFYNSKLYKKWEKSDLLRLIHSSFEFVEFKDSKNKIVRKLIHVKDGFLNF